MLQLTLLPAFESVDHVIANRVSHLHDPNASSKTFEPKVMLVINDSNRNHLRLSDSEVKVKGLEK